MSRNTSPRLRFAGFAGEWEEKTLGDIAEISSGGTPNRKEPLYWNGTIPWVTTSEVDNCLIQTTKEFITQLGLDNSAAKIFPKNTILMAMYGQGKTRGKVGILNIEATTNQACASIILDKQYSHEFIYQALASQYENIRLLSNSGGQDNLSTALIKNILFRLPEKEEQTALGNFFRRLDETLAQARARLAKTQQLKKAMLAKLFPQHNEPAPKLRFKGFSGDWERRALGEVAELYQPKTITGSDLTDSGYPVFGANGYIGFYNEANHFEDQVTISARGEGTGTPNYVIAPVWITGNSMVVNIDNNRGINKYFLHSLLSASSLKTYVTGGAQPQLTREVLTNVPLLFPTREEQTAIGNFFQKLDQTLALQSAALEKLTRLKKALLAAMLA